MSKRTSLSVVVCRGFSTPLRARRGAVIFDDLRAIQLRYGFLPKAELEGLSQRNQTPLYQIHSVASFYPHFHLAPPLMPLSTRSLPFERYSPSDKTIDQRALSHDIGLEFDNLYLK